MSDERQVEIVIIDHSAYTYAPRAGELAGKLAGEQDALCLWRQPVYSGDAAGFAGAERIYPVFSAVGGVDGWFKELPDGGPIPPTAPVGIRHTVRLLRCER